MTKGYLGALEVDAAEAAESDEKHVGWENEGVDVQQYWIYLVWERI